MPGSAPAPSRRSPRRWPGRAPPRGRVALREDAVRRGLSISEYSVTVVETGEERSFATEEEVYEFLGYAWIPPELRENGGELAAARANSLPELVSLSDLRVDLHTHTT